MRLIHELLAWWQELLVILSGNLDPLFLSGFPQGSQQLSVDNGSDPAGVAQDQLQGRSQRELLGFIWLQNS